MNQQPLVHPATLPYTLMTNSSRPSDIPLTKKPPKPDRKGTREEPLKEASFGIVPLKFIFEDTSSTDPQDAKEIQVLLVKLKSGDHWSFPKGHAELIGEKMETPKECAKRELWEETGLQVEEWQLMGEVQEEVQWQQGQGLTLEKVGYSTIDDHVTWTEEYTFEHKKRGWIDKTCTYFMAKVKGQVVIQPEEVLEYKWANFLEDEDLCTHEGSRQVWKLARSALAASWFENLLVSTTERVLDEVEAVVKKNSNLKEEYAME